MKTSQYSEQDIRSKYITPALQRAGWDLQTQILEEKSFTQGAITVYGQTVKRGSGRRVDYLLYYRDNFPLAIIEAKDAAHSVGSGMEQALNYAEQLDVPFVYSSNGKGFLEHDRLYGTERELTMEEFPSPQELYARYKDHHNLSSDEEQTIFQTYYQGARANSPRYYQRIAINRTVEAIARGKDRVLLVMATGTGKTYTAFQIIWRLWKAGQKKRILFLVDRKSLAYQTLNGDFRHFGEKRTLIDGPDIDTSYEVYIALYQGLHSNEEERKKFKQFSPDFFDLVVVDECHRGSAKANSAWREILSYFSSATQIGLTATPKEDAEADNRAYFGEPIYTYSLKQGINDGFLAPYKVVRYILDKDVEWRPSPQVQDRAGNPVEDRVYGAADYDKHIVLTERTKQVARTITQYLEDTDPMQKTIVFCENVDQAERLRQALVNENSERVRQNHRYVTRITGDNPGAARELENFMNVESRYPVVVTTSEMLTTGVDAKTCKLIVLDKTLNSVSEFKQIIGRGTRLDTENDKYYFTIMDFRGSTRLFADPSFDGEPFKTVQYDYAQEGEEPPSFTEEEEEPEAHEDYVPDSEDGAETILYTPEEDEGEKEPKRVPVVDGVDFNVSTRMIHYYDPETGKITAESLTDYSRKKIREKFPSLDEFFATWTEQARKDAVINELHEQGVPIEELKQEVGLNTDEFDTILHVAYNQKPLTRSERAKQAEENLMHKYEGKARQVVEALLEKYADQGSLAIDNIDDLEVSPFTDIGTPVEIVNEIFGGREAYFDTVRDVQQHLYAVGRS